MTDSPRAPASGHRPAVLCILDGWGERAERQDNAIALAETPNWDRLLECWPHARLATSGRDVGLPEGQMGNSEVGHTNIGAGRVVVQDLGRINAALADGDGFIAASPVLAAFAEALKDSGGTCHLLGLMSPGGVHSHQDHMAALARMLGDAGIPVAVHAFLDGRDTPPKSARGFMERFIENAGPATIATVSGRYYAMDRDRRWERVEKAYDALVEGMGVQEPEAVTAIGLSYQSSGDDPGVTDEFMLPTVIGGFSGMREGDGLLMANFRADRARQLLAALADPVFDGFRRSRVVDFASRLGMVEYSHALDGFYGALFPTRELNNILGQVIADAGLRQLRIAETEKYAHVTFFLNGGREDVFAGEERILVPSPKVATYDLKPEMSAVEVTDKLVAALAEDRFDLVVVNFANGDMVGHTGDLEATIKAVETIDSCLGRLEKAVIAAGGVLIVTADHGNCEMMHDEESGQPHTAHSLNAVPVVLINAGAGGLRDGSLADVAPTLLELMGLAQPAEMTGRSLIIEPLIVEPFGESLAGKDGAETAAAE